MLVADLIDELQKMPQHHVVMVAQCLEDADLPRDNGSRLAMLDFVESRGNHALIVPNVTWRSAMRMLEFHCP